MPDLLYIVALTIGAALLWLASVLTAWHLGKGDYSGSSGGSDV